MKEGRGIQSICLDCQKGQKEKQAREKLSGSGNSD